MPKSPRSGASPPRSRPKRAAKTPQRLGAGDGWGSGAAGQWTGSVSPKGTSPAAKGASPPKAKAKAQGGGGGAGLVGPLDVLVLGLAAYAFFSTLGASTDAIVASFDAVTSPEWLLIAGYVCLSQTLLYGYVWFNPASFKKACRSVSVAILAEGGKVWHLSYTASAPRERERDRPFAKAPLICPKRGVR